MIGDNNSPAFMTRVFFADDLRQKQQIDDRLA
jgi:hypothetical protein